MKLELNENFKHPTGALPPTGSTKSIWWPNVGRIFTVCSSTSPAPQHMEVCYFCLPKIWEFINYIEVRNFEI